MHPFNARFVFIALAVLIALPGCDVDGDSDRPDDDDSAGEIESGIQITSSSVLLKERCRDEAASIAIENKTDRVRTAKVVFRFESGATSARFYNVNPHTRIIASISEYQVRERGPHDDLVVADIVQFRAGAFFKAVLVSNHCIS